LTISAFAADFPEFSGLACSGGYASPQQKNALDFLLQSWASSAI
jgi:hypothetical protein